jgi:hypothetical protein
MRVSVPLSVSGGKDKRAICVNTTRELSRESDSHKHASHSSEDAPGSQEAGAATFRTTGAVFVAQGRLLERVAASR